VRRVPKPAAGRSVGYPSLRPAWLLLAGALTPGVALADSSVPVQVKKPGPQAPPLPGQMPAPRVVDATQPQDPKPNEPPPDANRNPKPRPRELPKLMGKIACPRKPPAEVDAEEPKESSRPSPSPDGAWKGEKPAPKPPKEYPRPKGDIARARRPQAPWQLLAALEDGAHVIHPHGPDEPCREIAHDEGDA
jgi:hypothetical protein